MTAFLLKKVSIFFIILLAISYFIYDEISRQLIFVSVTTALYALIQYISIRNKNKCS